MKSYTKDFDAWNIQKQYVDKTTKGDFYFNEREIWWCVLGVNIGVEVDGKHGSFERPVLVLKYINKDMTLVVPLTTKGKDDNYHMALQFEDRVSYAKISQIRVVSSKRLLRKIGMLDEKQYLILKERILKFLA